MKRILTILFIICAIAIDINAQTKVYPITVTISGNSNISASLSQLCSPQSTLMFTFQCLDRKESSLPVAVKVRLYPATGKGKSIENQVQMGRKTFDIGFGQTIVEQKTDLEKYFLTNFTNANQSGYYQNGQLVEGSYILQVVCYDARTISRQISNVAKIYLHIDQFNYPTLQFPRNNSDLEEYTTKPTLNFQWLNTGKTDPKIRYKFELWKVINSSSLETYVKQTRPIFVEENLFVTQKSYMPEILNLEIGQKYCWRVTAYDPEKTLSFKRNGESEVFQFQYLNPPVPVTGLKNKILGKQITYTWNSDKSHTKYIVEYYDYKRDTTISAEQTENILKLTAPDYDYRIKFRVKAVCYNDMSRTSDFTPWSEAYVQPENKVEYECGKRFPDREIENQELKTEFFEGEIVESKNGDSRYEIIKAESQGDGSLKGKFYAIMDCWGGAKILCDFWDTKINTDNIVLTTRYKSEDIPDFVADPEEIKKYVNELINNVNMAITDNTIRDTIVINQKFDYLYTENGRLKAVVLDDNGEPNVTDVTPEKSFTQALITDGQGDTAVVSKKGQVMGVKEYQFAGDNRHLLNEYHRQLDSLGEWIIQFDALDKQDYGFDKVSNKKGIFSGAEYYPYLSANYDLRYKSVETSNSDKVIVDFGSYPEKDSVIFKDKYGITLKLSKKNLLTFTAPNQADTNYIYAYRGDKKIGKLMLNVYKKKPIKVCLVMVNGAKHKESFDEIKKYLDKVYKPAVVEFEILHADFKMSELTSFSHGGSPWTSVYNEDQKRVLRAYNDSIKDGIYYLFFIDNVTDKKDGNGTMVSGYMPRGYNCGFIYDGGSPHTIAHELGHGIAGLEHVFENSKSSGKTNNLMDYASGEELWHFQWDAIQDPSRVWMKWNKDESEGESWGSYPTCVSNFLEAFRRAFVYREPFKFDIVNEYSAENIQLLNDKYYKKIGWETTKKINCQIDSSKIKKVIDESFFFDNNEYIYSYDGFTISSDNADIFDYLFPSKKVYDAQMKSYRNFIVNTLKDRDEIIRRLSTLPNNEFMNFYCRDREKLLNILARGELTDANSLIGVSNCVDGEKAAINLIKYVPDNQLDSLCKLLSGDFYKQLCSQIDDVFGDDNFTELNNIVNSIKRRSSQTAQVINEIRNYAGNGKFICDDKKLMENIINFPKTDFQLFLDCMFGKDGVFVELLDNPNNEFSKIVFDRLKLYYGNDLGLMPLTIRKEYLAYFSHYRLGMASYNNPFSRKFISLLLETTPDKDLPSIINLLDDNNRFIYNSLGQYGGGKAYYNSVYAKSKKCYSNNILPLEKREKYLLYYSRLKEVYEPEEFIVIDLIETTPKNDVKRLFDYMNQNDMFRNLGSNMDNFWGADNLDKFAEVLHNKWIEAGGSEKEYLRMTKQYFINPLWRNRAMFHYTFSGGGQLGLILTGVNVSVSFGLGFDTYGNIAFFGNANIFAYLLNNGFQFNKLSDLFYKSFDEAINDYKNFNILSGIGISIGSSYNFDFWADDVRALFGLGTTESIEVSRKDITLKMLFNYDGEGKFIGFGFGVDIGDGKSLPISYQKISETNRGLVFNLSDIPLLTNCKFDSSQKSKPSYEIENGKLVIRSWLGTIKTDLEAYWGDDDHNFIITDGCNFLIDK